MEKLLNKRKYAFFFGNKLNIYEYFDKIIIKVGGHR